MTVLDKAAWPLLGATSNSTFYRIEERVVAGVMNDGARDDRESARENQGFYHDYFREHGPGMLVYCLDSISHQTPSARHVYRDEADPELICCVGLLVRSLFSRAVGMFYLGIARPAGIPVKVSGSLEDVLAWGRPFIAKRARSAQ